MKEFHPENKQMDMTTNNNTSITHCPLLAPCWPLLANMARMHLEYFRMVSCNMVLLCQCYEYTLLILVSHWSSIGQSDNQQHLDQTHLTDGHTQ